MRGPSATTARRAAALPRFCGALRAFLLALGVAAASACAPRASDVTAHSGFVDSEGFQGADCVCVASAFQKNLDPDAFALVGRFYSLMQQDLVYSDGSPTRGAASTDAYAVLRRVYRDFMQKEREGGLKSDLQRLDLDLKACGGVFNGDMQSGENFTGPKLVNAFNGIR